jgi:hypothetical protein
MSASEPTAIQPWNNMKHALFCYIIITETSNSILCTDDENWHQKAYIIMYILNND